MDVIKRRDACLLVSPSLSMDSPVSVPLLDRSARNYTAAPTGTSATWELGTLSPVVSRVVSVVTSIVAASSPGNLSGVAAGSGAGLDRTHKPPAPSVPSAAAERNSALQGVAVAAQALVLLSIFLLSSLGNSAVAVVIVKHRRLRTVTNAFILSLSLSHFLAAVLCLPFSFAALLSGDGAWPFGERFCAANAFFNTCFGIISTLTVTLIAVDRYYAIARQPQVKIGRRNAARLLAAVWLAAVLLSLPWDLLGGARRERGPRRCAYAFHPGTSRVGAAYSVAVIAACHLLPFALMCFCHYNICKAVRLSEVRVRPVATYAHLLRFHSEMRTATTVLIMIVLVIACWGPYCLLGLLAALGGYSFHPAVDTVAIWLAWANGAINPLIYALRNPNISVLLGRGREEGYRTRNAGAYLSNRSQGRETRLNQVGQIRGRHASRGRVNHHGGNRCPSSSSPGNAVAGGGGEEVATWACKNPALFFCRDLQLDAPKELNSAGAPKVEAADTSL